MSITSIASSEPKYLGCRRDAKEYYFFAIKNGEGRFLKYVAYPLWCRSSDVADVLDISRYPADNIVEEVQAFILGKLQITIVPKTRGRSEKVIKTNLGADANASSNVDNDGPGGGSIIIPSEPPGNGRGRSSNREARAPVILSNSRQRIPGGKSGSSKDSHPAPLSDVRIVSIEKEPLPASPAPTKPQLGKPKRKRRTKAEMEAARMLDQQKGTRQK